MSDAVFSADMSNLLVKLGAFVVLFRENELTKEPASAKKRINLTNILIKSAIEKPNEIDDRL
jgi:hypothetical protein